MTGPSSASVFRKNRDLNFIFDESFAALTAGTGRIISERMFLTSHLPPSPANDVLSGVPENLLRLPFSPFEKIIPLLAFDGGIRKREDGLQPLPIFRDGSWAGYHLSRNARIEGTIRVAITPEGRWVIKTTRTSNPENRSVYLYSRAGKFESLLRNEPQELRQLPLRVFEPACPILNLLYQIASEEYPSPASGFGDTRLLHTIEKTLRTIDGEINRRGADDEAVRRFEQEMQRVEEDPVCTWRERQDWIRRIREERDLVIRTKRRVHGIPLLAGAFPLLLADCKAALRRFRLRPASNALGWLESLLLDPIRWFFRVVRGNMGYSVALAIYSPFTFFFITQPMNPHAMWAVGRVRSAYLDTVEQIRRIIHPAPATVIPAKASPPAPASAPEKISGSTGFPLALEDPAMSEQSWEERMSHFKAMQIAYEENLEIAPRMGRLEHMESQLNWPITAESAWLEAERFLQLISYLLANESEYDTGFISWVKREETRALHVELYLWDRLTRFLLDHPYILMDESKEQVQHSVYAGRAFVLHSTMSASLFRRFPGLLPRDPRERFSSLYEQFKREHRGGRGVVDRVRKNTSWYPKEGLPDAQGLRSGLRRQWEILYLLENRAQEAALSGLQLYVWSVRNAMHLLQSTYSTKRADLSHLALLFKHGANPSSLKGNPDFQAIESQYEAFLHLLVLEFTSVRKEIGEHLPKDIEARQRSQIISEFETSLEERDLVLRAKGLL